MTLATADEEGTPWASPVWYAPESYTSFLWVSKPEARHSRNLAARPLLGIVIFDSTAPFGGAEALYLEAEAAQLAGAEADRAIPVFSRRSQEFGAGEWTPAQVQPPAALRLYRATSSAQFVLDRNDLRVPVDLMGG
jgi:Pyridoxamine 5'-phosphate oxidase